MTSIVTAHRRVDANRGPGDALVEEIGPTVHFLLRHPPPRALVTNWRAKQAKGAAAKGGSERVSARAVCSFEHTGPGTRGAPGRSAQTRLARLPSARAPQS